MADGVNSVDHAMRLLGALAEGPRSMNVSALAARLELPRPTLYRLLKTLTQHRMVFREGTTYRLGYRILELGEATLAHSDLSAMAQPALIQLAKESGETAHFAVLESDRICYLAKEDSAHPIRMLSSVGWRGPLHACGGGKVLLAWSKPDTLQRIVAQPLERFTKKTITEPAALIRNIEATHARGYGEDLEELLDGLVCIAVPVQIEGRLLGALSIAGPASRMRDRCAMLPLLRKAAETITAPLRQDAAVE